MSQEYSQFTPSEMITLYMDGELPEALQPSLFAMLSEQADLRQEMQDHFTVRRHMDTNLIAPPIEMEESIMRRIGAVAVGASINNPVSTGLATSVSTWFGKAVQPLMFILLGATLSGMYFAFMNEQSEQVSQTVTSDKSSGQQFSNAPISAPILPKAARVKNSLVAQNRTAMKTVIAQQSTLSDAQNLLLEAPMTQTTESSSLVNPSKSSDANSPIITTQNDIPKDISKNIPIVNTIEDVSPFSLTLRGFTNHSFIDQTVPTSIDPFINNVSIGMQYDLSKEDAIFVEVGQEAIVQRFNGIENNYLIQYDQIFHAPWAMIGWQHRFNGGSSVKPLIRVGTGAMETGPMARMTLGIEYDLTRNITLIGGIEGMSTFYAYKGQWFSTQKAGITYGTRISLR